MRPLTFFNNSGASATVTAATIIATTSLLQALQRTIKAYCAEKKVRNILNKNTSEADRES